MQVTWHGTHLLSQKTVMARAKTLCSILLRFLCVSAMLPSNHQKARLSLQMPCACASKSQMKQLPLIAIVLRTLPFAPMQHRMHSTFLLLRTMTTALQPLAP